jgi:membrane fusion protein (multidrug efflux system)
MRRLKCLKPSAASSFALLLAYAPLTAQKVELVPVVSKRVQYTVELPGEFYPFLSVQLHAKVPGYIDEIYVDRGSFVRKGQLLVQLSAPEMMERIAQARAQLTAAESDESQAAAQFAAAKSTYAKMLEASRTPGAIAPNDLVQAKAQADAAEALVRSRQRNVDSLRSNLKADEDLASYLRVTAPFDGVISTRFVHPGALVGPGHDVPLLQLDQIARLRLDVAVPEADVAGIAKGDKVEFRVQAYPNRTFTGVVARPAYVVERSTRTMSVELDVSNPEYFLAPGMYGSVLWPVRKAAPSLLVPPTSIVTTTERVFVIRNDHGKARWIDVRRGYIVGNLVEVYGNLKPGDQIVEHATDEIRDGSRLPASN